MTIEPIPAIAERLAFSDAVKLVQRQSVFVPSRVAITEIFVCPGCKTEGEALVDFKTRQCPGCGLKFQLREASVYVWPNVPDSTAVTP
jgi:hypothetical protein